MQDWAVQDWAVQDWAVQDWAVQDCVMNSLTYSGLSRVKAFAERSHTGIANVQNEPTMRRTKPPERRARNRRVKPILPEGDKIGRTNPMS